MKLKIYIGFTTSFHLHNLGPLTTMIVVYEQTPIHDPPTIILLPLLYTVKLDSAFHEQLDKGACSSCFSTIGLLREHCTAHACFCQRLIYCINLSFND